MALADRRRVLAKIEAHISAQLTSEEAERELTTLGPRGFDWNSRVRTAVSALLPKLVDIAPTLINECLKPFNSSVELRDYLNNELFDKAHIQILDQDEREGQRYKALLKKCRELSQQSTIAVANIESQQISAEVRRFLLSANGLGTLIKETGGSIYPDLVLAAFDYSFLPFQKRNKPISGPCLKNPKSPIPSNVPDGLEIKTNQSKQIKVDAHGAHPGLHLGITWGLGKDLITIYDIWVAYIRVKDYSISDGNVDVTTKKRSFGHSPFVSLIRGEK